MEAVNGELETKYQKIATEYSKASENNFSHFVKLIKTVYFSFVKLLLLLLFAPFAQLKWNIKPNLLIIQNSQLFVFEIMSLRKKRRFLLSN